MSTLSWKHAVMVVCGLGAAIAFLEGGSIAQVPSQRRVAHASEKSVRFYRTALIQPGKGQEAMKFIQDVKQHFQESFPEASVAAYLEAFGDVGRVHWFADYTDLATLEKVMRRMEQDQAWNDLVSRGPELFERPSDKLMMLTR